MKVLVAFAATVGLVGCATTSQDRAQHNISNKNAKQIELLEPVTISNLVNTHVLKAGVYIQTGMDDEGEYYTPSTNNLVTAPQIRGVYVPNDSNEVCAIYYEFNNCEPAKFKKSHECLQEGCNGLA
ncbi:hypothetical protein ACVX70_003141 [Vibrio alginolyticus]